MNFKCPTCGQFKAESDFGFRNSEHTKRQSVCRECNNISASSTRAKARLVTLKVISLNRSKRLYQLSNPDKTRAVSALNQKIASGKIIRPAQCSKCGSESKPEAHHEDYSKPFEVIWLCKGCHGKTRIKTNLVRS